MPKLLYIPAIMKQKKTDTKGKVLIEKPSELESYSNSEEDAMERKVQGISNAGISLVVCGGTVSEMAMHFFERYKIMVVKTASKFELRRVCQATGATALLSMLLAAPAPEELGFIELCEIQEIGSTKVAVFQNTSRSSHIGTIVLRGATENILDDIERSIDDAVNVFKSMTKDPRFVAGAGASEIELSRLLQQYAEQTPGEDQYAINKFGESFEIVARTLAENAGMDATSVIATLYAKHSEGNVNFGVDIENHEVSDATKLKVFDHLITKKRAIELATNAVATVLRVTQIIMAKPSGIPVPGQKGSGSMGSYDSGETM